jgi:chaperonin cofactor prefoldin|tara:strand:+ start:195 stop:332 length:138 start_codon:yes stop_codon:yes gene_type:complete
MNINNILTELDEIIEKLKLKIIYLQTENETLRHKLIKLKQYVGKI